MASRALAKQDSVRLATALCDLRSPLEASYRSTIYCTTHVEQDEDGCLRTHYCGQRWCKVCNRIRTAQLIDRYRPAIDSWAAPAFVTLTVKRLERNGSPAEEEEALAARLDALLDAFNRAKRSVRRTAGIAFQAVRKLEVTTDVVKGYHAHYHLLVDSMEAGEALIAAWLKFAPKVGLVAERGGQDVRRATEGSTVELFKYFTKLPSKPCPSTLIMLDVSMRAMRRRRVVQPVGVEVEGAEAAEEVDPTTATVQAWDRKGEAIMWEWDDDVADWVDRETGQMLVCYTPSDVEPVGFVLDSMCSNPP